MLSYRTTYRYEDCEACRGSGFVPDYDSLGEEGREFAEATGDIDIGSLPPAFCDCPAGDEAYEAAKASGYNPLEE